MTSDVPFRQADDGDEEGGDGELAEGVEAEAGEEDVLAAEHGVQLVLPAVAHGVDDG